MKHNLNAKNTIIGWLQKPDGFIDGLVGSPVHLKSQAKLIEWDY